MWQMCLFYCRERLCLQHLNVAAAPPAGAHRAGTRRTRNWTRPKVKKNNSDRKSDKKRTKLTKLNHHPSANRETVLRVMSAENHVSLKNCLRFNNAILRLEFFFHVRTRSGHMCVFRRRKWKYQTLKLFLDHASYVSWLTHEPKHTHSFF